MNGLTIVCGVELWADADVRVAQIFEDNRRHHNESEDEEEHVDIEQEQPPQEREVWTHAVPETTWQFKQWY